MLILLVIWVLLLDAVALFAYIMSRWCFCPGARVNKYSTTERRRPVQLRCGSNSGCDDPEDIRLNPHHLSTIVSYQIASDFDLRYDSKCWSHDLRHVSIFLDETKEIQ
jgi:hypothetical protein